MPIRPSPQIYSCTSCKWSQRVAPKSDCLGPHDYFTSCPKCGSSVTQKDDALVITLQRLGRLLGIK